jgi:hypothetical protein
MNAMGPHNIAILNLLRMNKYMLRSDFFASILSAPEYQNSGREVVHVNLLNLERKGLISIDRADDQGSFKPRLISMRLTDRGAFELARLEMIAMAHRVNVNMPDDPPVHQKHIKKEKPQPCGLVTKNCLHTGCYLAYKCSIKQKELYGVRTSD